MLLPAAAVHMLSAVRTLADATFTFNRLSVNP